MQRRDVIFGATQLAALMAWRRLFAAGPSTQPALSGWKPSAAVFTLGVASGEPRPQSVVIWTRLAPVPLQADGGMPPQPVPVRWEVADDARFERIVRKGDALAEPGKAHSVHVEVEGLHSDRRYHYRFIAGGQTSPVGRTRTAPHPMAPVGRLRLALASCQHYEMGYYAAHREIAASDIDFVLFVGDYIYETGSPYRWQVRRHHQVLEDGDLTLPHYRIHHANYKLDADLRACHAAHPWLLTWDDHDVRNDYDGLHDAGGLDVEAFTQVRAAAYQAYFEHLPISPKRAPVGPDAAMNTQYRWGTLADLWLLDTRQFRSGTDCAWPHALLEGRLLWTCPQAQTKAESRSVLGPTQERWLADALAASTGAWRLIAQTTQIAPGGFNTPWGPLLYADGWDAFPAARERLMAAIAQPRVPDVVCLGGDVHRHVAANLRLHPQDARSPIIASEFVSSSITTRGLSELMNSWMASGNPDLLHLRSDERGYALIDISPARLRCDFRATAHPVKPDSKFHTQASYVVERGVAGPRKV
jgi:alkaline phosphatase D